ncbi:MAG: hypothetical protein JWR67_2322 [Mucilaginibacter sp.]|nr:hypothetical protein [Mucilaginibacter sp.]
MEHLVNKENVELLNVLANPADAKYAYALNIQSFVNEFPQSGILRALLTAKGDEKNVQHAAVYFNPAILYKIFNAPDSLPVVNSEQIVWVDSPLCLQAAKSVSETTSESKTLDFTAEEADIENNQPVETNGYLTETSADEQQDFAAEEDAAAHYLPTEVTETSAVDSTYNEPATNTSAENKEPEHAVAHEPEYFHQDIEDEIYDEIVSIEDINLEQLATFNSGPVNTVNDENEVLEETVSEIPPADHFVFDTAFTTKEEDTESKAAVSVTDKEGSTGSAADEKQGVSRYYDEKLPYSFMWWLDKTRKEHAGIYQPYIHSSDTQAIAATPAVKKNAADELQHQYVENIFNLNAIEELERSTAAKSNEPVIERKEDKIIKRFIEAEPQIKHPSGGKLDNENKAKKSSEDREELITETLARIYTEQMLYQKAILAYKKLMLKFPEKSLYFASQIEQLEKKPN